MIDSFSAWGGSCTCCNCCLSACCCCFSDLPAKEGNALAGVGVVVGTCGNARREIQGKGVRVRHGSCRVPKCHGYMRPGCLPSTGHILGKVNLTTSFLSAQGTIWTTALPLSPPCRGKEPLAAWLGLANAWFLLVGNAKRAINPSWAPRTGDSRPRSCWAGTGQRRKSDDDYVEKRMSLSGECPRESWSSKAGCHAAVTVTVLTWKLFFPLFNC